MVINVEDIETGQFESLEEFTRYVEAQINIPEHNSDKRNRLRYQLFKKWHDLYGFTSDDTGYVIACSFDVEMFSDKKEDALFASQAKEDTSSYRKEREETIKDSERYASEIYKKSRGAVKKKGKKKGVLYNELRDRILEEHKKEQEITACIFRAKKSLQRKKKYQPDTVINTESIVQQIIIEEGRGNLDYSIEELYQSVDEFLNKGEDATLSLRMSSDELLKKADAYIEKNQKKLIVWTLMGITAFNLTLLIIRYCMCIATLDPTVVSNNAIYITLSICLSTYAWVYSTTQDYFNFHNIKWRTLIMVLANDAATLLQLYYSVIWRFAVVNIFKITTNDLFSENMVINLARIVVTVGLSIGILAAYKLIKPFITADEAKEKILAFKLRHVVDNRENKEFKYDFCVVKDLKTGKPIIVKEHDLYTHMLLLGASGTGKTSSIYIPQIVENIRKKQKNVEMQQREVLRLMQLNGVEITEPFARDKFSKRYLKAKTPEMEKKLEEIFEKYVECGITVIAPNNSMNEDILSYASGRGIWVNNLDPSKKKATHPYERLVGMNPFYMPNKFHEIEAGDLDAEEERTIYIAESANNFADALAAINELNGSADPYFTDVNTTVTSSIATLIMLHASIKGTQVTIDDVNNCIQDFGLLPSYILDVKRHFNIKYVNQNPDQKQNKKEGAKIKRPDEDLSEEDEKKVRQQIYEQLTDEDRKNPYIQTIITCESRLWKGSTMDTHAEGLRNLIRKLLQDPRIKRVLVNNKDILDFNEILSDNAITVVNTALEFGKNTSTCFGQLFILNFNSAVLRRPKKERTPHFFYEDETARYLSDTIDTSVTLYRQFGVSCSFALQTLEQVEKVPGLKYLRNSLLSAGTIISFGRASYADAQTISDLGGQERYDMVQKTVSRKSILASNAESSFSERTTPDTKNYVDPHDVRYRDFQECTILYTDEGHVLPARLGKAFFVPKDVLFGIEQKQIDQNNAWRQIWRSRYPLTEDIIPISPDTTISPKTNLDTAITLKNNSTGSVIMNKTNEERRREIVSDKTAEDLKNILNTEKENILPITDAEVLDHVKLENGHPSNEWAYSADDEWTFSDEIKETDTTPVFSKSVSAQVYTGNSVSSSEAILSYDEEDELIEEDLTDEADYIPDKPDITDNLSNPEEESSVDSTDLEEEELRQKLKEQRRKRLEQLKKGIME